MRYIFTIADCRKWGGRNAPKEAKSEAGKKALKLPVNFTRSLLAIGCNIARG